MKQLTDEVRDAQFEAWWEKSGQFCRSGGGAYEKTFAYTAWLAALDTAQPVLQAGCENCLGGKVDAGGTAHDCAYPDCVQQSTTAAVLPDGSTATNVYEAFEAGRKAQPVQVNAMLVEALQAAEKLEHEALVALSEATDELKVGNPYTTATDTYKSNNDLIHRLDKILNSQYRDRKRTALTAAQQAQVNSDAETEAIKRFGHTERAEAFVAGWAAAQQAQPEPRPTEDALWDETLKDRDAYHQFADDLAAQIAAITGVDIGEHSNMNNPWQEAMLAADDFIATQLKTMLLQQAQPERPLNCGTGHCSCIDCPYEQAQPERAPLSDAEIEDLRGEANRGYCIDKGAYFKAFRDAEQAHGIKQGGQHD